MVEHKIQYDGAGTKSEYAACQLSSAQPTRTCTVEFDIKDEIEGPVYVYYELENFYQNHRRYVKSRSDAQLRGDEVPDSKLMDSCDPLWQKDGKTLNPCGLIANSMFNGAPSAGRPPALAHRGRPLPRSPPQTCSPRPPPPR